MAVNYPDIQSIDLRLVKEILELIIDPNSRKRKEFSQTLSNLGETLQSSCSSMKIIEAEDSPTINIVVKWETAAEMHRTLKGDEFVVLSGAITALCEKTIIRLNDKLVGNHISMLANIKKTKPKYQKS